MSHRCIMNKLFYQLNSYFDSKNVLHSISNGHSHNLLYLKNTYGSYACKKQTVDAIHHTLTMSISNIT